MEKFGIFELLDALSAAMESERKSERENGTEKETEAPPPVTSPRSDDKAFSPPDYSGNPSLSSLLEKHEKIVKRIKK